MTGLGFSDPPANPSAPVASLGKLDVDPVLMNALIAGTQRGLSMTRASMVAVGASRITTARHPITVMLGVVGHHSGNIALNLSELAALSLATGLFGEPQKELDDNVVDAVMELGNMVTGAIKVELASTDYAVSHISLPSLILGPAYSMVHARGIQTVSVEFELPDLPFSTMNARFFSSTVSLLRGSGARSW